MYEQAKEKLMILGGECWKEFLRYTTQNSLKSRQFSERYVGFSSLVDAIAQLDCLLSLATVSREKEYSKPLISEEKNIVSQVLFAH